VSLHSRAAGWAALRAGVVAAIPRHTTALHAFVCHQQPDVFKSHSLQARLTPIGKQLELSAINILFVPSLIGIRKTIEAINIALSEPLQCEPEAQECVTVYFVFRRSPLQILHCIFMVRLNRVVWHLGI
jgi:hypothetical protein